MTTQLRRKLEAWLSTGNEIQRRHAEAKLSGIAPEPEPEADPPPLAPLPDSIRGVRLGQRNCWYSTREECGCSGVHCWHLGRVAALPDCLSCLAGPCPSNVIPG